MTKRETLEKACMKLWGLIVRGRANHICQWPGCGRPGNQPHHFFHKSRGNIAKYEIDNGICLCWAHHQHQVHQNGYTEPLRDLLIKRLGQDGFDAMKAKIDKAWSPSIDALRELKQELENLLAGMPDQWDYYKEVK